MSNKTHQNLKKRDVDIRNEKESIAIHKAMIKRDDVAERSSSHL